MILEAPAATLEIVDADHEPMVDDLEAGRPFDKRARIAVRVDDLGEAAREVSDARREAISAAVDTPWGDRNQRFTTRRSPADALRDGVGGSARSAPATPTPSPRTDAPWLRPDGYKEQPS